MIKPGEPGYEEMINRMRLDLATDFEFSRQAQTIEAVCRRMFEKQGRDFDKEFAEYMKKKGGD
jgi:hypothetical protein